MRMLMLLTVFTGVIIASSVLILAEETSGSEESLLSPSLVDEENSEQGRCLHHNEPCSVWNSDCCTYAKCKCYVLFWNCYCFTRGG
uniref:U35-Hexatoxin-Hc1a_1 n=1 Tax=Hadronyche cerberea TaxID=1107879 RepID=A0A4Q8KB62_HADCE